ncbi:MAG: InlB B-repeat-containing protein [Lachnospiraceae bacterium]|nr:InlB B-repeat-containing protein [Lachnospiraceae bacterium]
MGRKTLLLLISVFSFFILPVSVKAESAKTDITFVEVEAKDAEGYMADDFVGEDDSIDAVGASLSKYGTDYIYDQLGSDEKELWDGLDEICTTKYSDTSTISSSGGYYPVGYVEYDGLSTEEAKEVANLFKYSRPQYYYLDTKVLLYYYPGTERGGVSMTCYKAFAKGSSRKTATSKVESKLSKWNKKVKKASGTVAKEKVAHDLIVNNTKYTSGASYNQSCYSVLVNGKSVCAGYATTFSMLMNYAGITTLNITSSYHEWNLIKIGSYWYNVDVTFDDPVTTSGNQMLRYTYFNRSDKKIKADDSFYLEHTRESMWSGYAPSAKKDSGATASSIGSVSEGTSKYTVTLKANGGYIGSSGTTSKKKTVTYGKKYGTLTSPKRKGYTFLGWYTKKSGGSKVTKSTKVTTSKNHTLYAHWKKISLGKTTIKSVKNSSSKAISITLKKISSADGYKIQYSLKKSMSNAKTKTVTKTSAKIKSLKKGKTYYIRVRAYKKDSAGKLVYGKYSSVKSIKIKK